MNTVISERIASFAETARGFCLWCESRSLEASREVTAAMWLASLHANALRLPKAASDNSDGLPDIPEELLSHAKRNLANFDGYYYREYFDPNPTLNEESVIGDVGDDLLDTYKDIRAGLILFDRGESSEALWHWSFLHQVHWGHHAVGAMFALHCMQTSEQE
jgi:hypothetical protein